MKRLGVWMLCALLLLGGCAARQEVPVEVAETDTLPDEPVPAADAPGPGAADDAPPAGPGGAGEALPAEEDAAEDAPRITEAEAINLLRDLLGDVSEETGFEYSFGIAGTVEVDGARYYHLRLSWLVQGAYRQVFNLSYVDTYLIACDGSEILLADQGAGDPTPVYPAVWTRED